MKIQISNKQLLLLFLFAVIILYNGLYMKECCHKEIYFYFLMDLHNSTRYIIFDYVYKMFVVIS